MTLKTKFKYGNIVSFTEDSFYHGQTGKITDAIRDRDSNRGAILYDLILYDGHAIQNIPEYHIAKVEANNER